MKLSHQPHSLSLLCKWDSTPDGFSQTQAAGWGRVSVSGKGWCWHPFLLSAGHSKTTEEGGGQTCRL